MSEQIKLLSPLEAIHKYASELTTKARELEQMEREYKIVPGQATAILSQMIENYLYTIFKTMIYNNRVSPEDKEAAFTAMTQLLRDNPSPPPPS